MIKRRKIETHFMSLIVALSIFAVLMCFMICDDGVIKTHPNDAVEAYQRKPSSGDTKRSTTTGRHPVYTDAINKTEEDDDVEISFLWTVVGPWLYDFWHAGPGMKGGYLLADRMGTDMDKLHLGLISFMGGGSGCVDSVKKNSLRNGICIVEYMGFRYTLQMMYGEYEWSLLYWEDGYRSGDGYAFKQSPTGETIRSESWSESWSSGRFKELGKKRRVEY